MRNLAVVLLGILAIANLPIPGRASNEEEKLKELMSHTNKLLQNIKAVALYVKALIQTIFWYFVYATFPSGDPADIIEIVAQGIKQLLELQHDKLSLYINLLWRVVKNIGVVLSLN